MKKEIWVLLYSEYSFMNGSYPLHVEPLSRFDERGPGQHPNIWRVIAQGTQDKIMNLLEEKHRELEQGIGSVRFIEGRKEETIKHITLLPYANTISELPKDSGIYFVMYEDEIIYVGKSVNIYDRWSRTHKMKSMEFTHIHYVIYKNINKMDTDEAAYISILCPKYNEVISFSRIKRS